MVPRICVLGATLEEACKVLDALCDANTDYIYRRRHDVAIMNDGTELIAMPLSDPDRFYGRNFDYVFYEKGMLIRYCASYGVSMEYLEQRCLRRSVVPREFQWCDIEV